ncbi:hypothetical protein NQ176_g757 [Zarea fungicola]|uniref:Uncharacterized protein n=1 Tax=Zarea fungicola TaxID=93591 RepID=A0ACC1NW50_9HYPO|nr:hypothetical protein NQ176_g757 [Lecanicillium fungicola]
MDSPNHRIDSATRFNPYLENQDKVALVAQLEAIYVRRDSASSFIRRPDPRRVTGWEQGIFYLPSRDTLLDLLHDEMHVKWMGDMSKKFVTKMFEPSSSSWDSPELDAVKAQDIATCVVTGKQYTVAPALLIPPGFDEHMIPPMIFDDETTHRLKRLVKSLADPASSLEESSLQRSVSTITLDWEMHSLFAEGWVGFRPVDITEQTTTTTTTTTSGNSTMYYVEHPWRPCGACPP